MRVSLRWQRQDAYGLFVVADEHRPSLSGSRLPTCTGTQRHRARVTDVEMETVNAGQLADDFRS